MFKSYLHEMVEKSCIIPIRYDVDLAGDYVDRELVLNALRWHSDLGITVQRVLGFSDPRYQYAHWLEKADGLPAIIDSTGDSMTNESGKYLTRLRKEFHKAGIDFSTEEWNSIAQTVQTYAYPAPVKSTMRFVDSILWDDGCYGHYPSCWWRQYSESRATWIAAGGYGMLFYPLGCTDLTHEAGIGRQWVMPYGDHLIICNPYGPESAVPKRAASLARYLGKAFELPLVGSAVVFYNRVDEAVPYINGHSAIAVGRDFIQETTIALDMPIHDGEPHRSKVYPIRDWGSVCDCCGNRVPDNQLTETVSGAEVCRTCLSDEYATCECCGYYYPNGDLTEVRNGDWVCPDCLSNSYTRCWECGEYVDNDSMTTTAGGDEVCEECIDQYYVECQHCGEWTRRD